MLRDQTVDRLITARLTEENKKEREERKSSGKLSASRLYWPLQWQVLKSIGVPEADPDEYALRKFLRGKQVEEWFVGHLPGVLEKQKFTEYRDTIGYIDAYVDSSSYEFKFGNIPHEVKSVSNAKYKRLVQEMAPDPSHALQGAFYALSLGASHFAIDYVATDDYRVECFVLEANKFYKQINEIIDKFQEAMDLWKKEKKIPEFKPNANWQASPMYNSYYDYIHMSTEIKNTIIEKYWKEV